MNINNVKFLTIFITLIVFQITIKAQAVNNYYREIVYKKNIRTVLFHQKGNQLSNPNIRLNSEERVVLSFDDLNNDPIDYYYTITHCNKNWRESNLMKSEYISGFNENPITEYDYSFNTLVPYVHYSLELPNDDINITKSGNYVVRIYSDSSLEDIVLCKRFTIYEPQTTIEYRYKRPLGGNNYQTAQELNLEINTRMMDINDPYSQIYVTVLQNNDWNTARMYNRPDQVRDNVIIYNDHDSMVFKGGNEFRYLDIKNEKYQSERIKRIGMFNDYYIADLHPDKDLLFEPYFYHRDINGKYLVKRDLSPNSNLEADYMFVHFTLDYDRRIVLGKPYLYGALTDWECTGKNMLTWNEDNRNYEITLMLKQGYYNYKYVIKLPDGKIKHNIFSGTHFDTQNIYNVYVYYNDPIYRYDRLVSTRTINTKE